MNTKTNLNQELLDLLSDLKKDKNVNPSVIYKQNTRIRLMNLITDEEKAIERKSSFVFVKNPKFAFRLAGTFLIILVFISTGTILAAQSTTPKNTLYQVKLASEEIALKISPSPFKANIAIEIAKRRGGEITFGEKSNSKSEIKHGLDKYKESISKARVFIPSSNTQLNKELEDEEGNLNELTREYENSQSNENKTNTNNKAEGASDPKIEQFELNSRQKTEERKNQTIPQQGETNSLQNYEKSLEDTRTYLENEFEKIISPQPSEENK